MKKYLTNFIKIAAYLIVGYMLTSAGRGEANMVIGGVLWLCGIVAYGRAIKIAAPKVIDFLFTSK